MPSSSSKTMSLRFFGWEEKNSYQYLYRIVVEWSLVSCLNLRPVLVVRNCLLEREWPSVNLHALLRRLKRVRLFVVTIVTRVFRNY